MKIFFYARPTNQYCPPPARLQRSAGLRPAATRCREQCRNKPGVWCFSGAWSLDAWCFFGYLRTALQTTHDFLNATCPPSGINCFRRHGRLKKMKRSTAVTLVISGALLAGCDDHCNFGGCSSRAGTGTNASISNNTYLPGHGYWHAPYHDWYPYPYNYYRPGFGYYYGGGYYDRPEASSITASSPPLSSFSGSSGWTSGGGTSDGGHSSSVSRGGFGGSAHGGGGGSE